MYELKPSTWLLVVAVTIALLMLAIYVVIGRMIHVEPAIHVH